MTDEERKELKEYVDAISELCVKFPKLSLFAYITGESGYAITGDVNCMACAAMNIMGLVLTGKIPHRDDEPAMARTNLMSNKQNMN